MKNLILFLSILNLHFFAKAENHDLCRRWYSFDIFQTSLRLMVEPAESVLVMDRHIPYGIRPMGHKISKMTCDRQTRLLQILASTDFDTPFLFSVQPVGKSLTQIGTATYYDQQGNPTATQEWECSQEAVKKLCLEL